MSMRFDGKVYRDCKWCYGKGCTFCPGEAERAYQKAFPDGPVPLATFKADNPDDVAAFKAIFGREALEKAFGEGGGGMTEIEDNLRKAGR